MAKKISPEKFRKELINSFREEEGFGREPERTGDTDLRKITKKSIPDMLEWLKEKTGRKWKLIATSVYGTRAREGNSGIGNEMGDTSLAKWTRVEIQGFKELGTVRSEPICVVPSGDGSVNRDKDPQIDPHLVFHLVPEGESKELLKNIDTINGAIPKEPRRVRINIPLKSEEGEEILDNEGKALKAGIYVPLPHRVEFSRIIMRTSEGLTFLVTYLRKKIEAIRKTAGVEVKEVESLENAVNDFAKKTDWQKIDGMERYDRFVELINLFFDYPAEPEIERGLIEETVKEMAKDAHVKLAVGENGYHWFGKGIH